MHFTAGTHVHSSCRRNFLHIFKGNIIAFHRNVGRVQRTQVDDVARGGSCCRGKGIRAVFSKGVQFALVKFPRGKIQVPNIHLRSGTEQNPVRVDQVNTTRTF